MNTARNQCDGCAVGAPLNSHGHHVYPNGGGLIGCTADRYRNTLLPQEGWKVVYLANGDWEIAPTSTPTIPAEV